MKKLLLSAILVATSFTTFAQVGVGTTTPNGSAALDITSTTSGLLPPRMTEAQRDLIGTPAAGLMVYCTDCGANGEPQFYNGTSWVNMVGGGAAAGPPPTPNVTNPTTGKIWMDRNLGASQVATSSADADSYGDLYQWGRGTDGHQIRTSSITATLSAVDQPLNGSFIVAPNDPYDWRSPQNTNLWQGVSGVNNPCPSGYRLPTSTELDAERSSWSSNDAAGAFASPLKLPVAGFRFYSNGSLLNVGTWGYYWSSTLNTTITSYLNFSSNNASTIAAYRSRGYSVRCIKE
jgi:uncharacterized protein (TIGR02145 family)